MKTKVIVVLETCGPIRLMPKTNGKQTRMTQINCTNESGQINYFHFRSITQFFYKFGSICNSRLTTQTRQHHSPCSQVNMRDPKQQQKPRPPSSQPLEGRWVAKVDNPTRAFDPNWVAVVKSFNGCIWFSEDHLMREQYESFNLDVPDTIMKWWMDKNREEGNERFTLNCCKILSAYLAEHGEGPLREMSRTQIGLWIASSNEESIQFVWIPKLGSDRFRRSVLAQRKRRKRREEEASAMMNI